MWLAVFVCLDDLYVFICFAPSLSNRPVTISFVYDYIYTSALPKVSWYLLIIILPVFHTGLHNGPNMFIMVNWSWLKLNVSLLNITLWPKFNMDNLPGMNVTQHRNSVSGYYFSGEPIFTSVSQIWYVNITANNLSALVVSVFVPFNHYVCTMGGCCNYLNNYPPSSKTNTLTLCVSILT